MKKRGNSAFAVGIFDSGLGGLTVVKEVIKSLPFEDIVYFGDTARVPYGTKSKESIVRFSLQNAKVLMQNNVKMIIVACNSSSSYALPLLRKKFKVPILGVINPGARKAADITKNKKIGIIATSATVKSQAYDKSVKHFNESIKVFSQACPLFVPLAEEGWFNNKVTLDIAKLYLKGLKKKGIDTLILGCTHYPLLKNTIKKTMGTKVNLVDSAREVALMAKKILSMQKNLRTKGRTPKYSFLISDRPQEFQKIAKAFLGQKITNVKKV